MTIESSRKYLFRPILYGVSAQLIAFLVSILVVSVYAIILAFQALGRPNQALINHFAAMTAPWVTLVTGIVLTFVFARKLSKTTSNHSSKFRVVVGISSATISTLVNLAFRPHFGLRSVIIICILVFISWLGAVPSIICNKHHQST